MAFVPSAMASSLPIEIIERVLANLQVEDIWIARNVNQTWRLASAKPSLWRKVEIPSYVPRDDVHDILHMYGKHTETLLLTGSWSENLSTVSLAVPKMKNLTAVYVELIGKNLNKFYSATLQQFLRFCDSLCQLQLKHLATKGPLFRCAPYHYLQPLKTVLNGHGHSLVKFRMVEYAFLEGGDWSRTLVHGEQLRKVEIGVRHLDDQVLRTLSALPKLRSFVVCNSDLGMVPRCLENRLGVSRTTKNGWDSFHTDLPDVTLTVRVMGRPDAHHAETMYGGLLSKGARIDVLIVTNPMLPDAGLLTSIPLIIRAQFPHMEAPDSRQRPDAKRICLENRAIYAVKTARIDVQVACRVWSSTRACTLETETVSVRWLASEKPGKSPGSEVEGLTRPAPSIAISHPCRWEPAFPRRDWTRADICELENRVRREGMLSPDLFRSLHTGDFDLK